MPTISQLPPATQATPADLVPLSQSGVTHSVTISTLLAGTQPAILADSGTLLGRTSVGPGGPEPIAVGPGLVLNTKTLSATGADHANFATQPSLTPTDEVVLSSNGQPRLMAVAMLRGLFSAGSNVSIDSSGTISANGGGQANSIANLPPVSTLSPQDLIAISQQGTLGGISYAALLDGQTIDMAQAATPAQDSDQFWVAQGSSTLLRQTLGALWAWIAGKLPSYSRPVVELTTNTTLDTTVHNNRVLICSQALSLQAAAVNLGNGFSCEVINLSNGVVAIAGSVVTPSGDASIPSGQMAMIRCVGYSGGTVIYASLTDGPVATNPPATVGGVAVTSSAQSTVSLSWTPAAAATSYLVEYRVQGAADWLVACSGLAGTAYTVVNLLPSTTYEFGIMASNSAGNSANLATIAAATAAPLAVPGQVTGLATVTVTTSSITLRWLQPTSGGTVASYTVQFRLSGSGNWTTSAAGLVATQCTVTGLVPNTAYDFQVCAVNVSGTGLASNLLTGCTAQATGLVTSIAWNLLPSGPYAHGTGTIAVNAHINPGTATVQFGFSSSASVLPMAWTAANFVNTDLWGAYVPTPSTAGSWFVWVSGTDGSCPTVYPTGFTVT